jgi:hypothetical protein
MLKFSGVIMCLGAFMFLAAAFSPISRVFGVPEARRKLEMIRAAPGAWRISQWLFGGGALLFALGVALGTYALRGRLSAPLLYLPAALLLTGAAFWTWHVYLRALDPPAFVEEVLPGWHFRLYTVFILAALALIGAGLRQMAFPGWAGWVLLGGAGVLFVLYVILKDMPPFVHYLLGLLMGVLFIRFG